MGINGRMFVAPWPGVGRRLLCPRYVLMTLSKKGVIYQLYIGALVYLHRMAAQGRHGRVWIELNMEPAYNPLPNHQLARVRDALRRQQRKQP